ncbi:hypothetical protein FQN57_003673 [Myotisia sp. PD_48]|nr:hypothetical protein FQN57_003673 [Myotisia sp. PD_48]
MPDALSIAAGTAGFISLGIQVTTILVKFYNACEGQSEDIARTLERLRTLLGIFTSLDAVLRSRKFRLDEQDLIKEIEASVDQCVEAIEELQAECQKFETSPSANSKKGVLRLAGRRVAYPLRESTLNKLNEEISSAEEDISIALDLLQLRDHTQTHNDIDSVKALLQRINTAQVSESICNWLKAPDVTLNHDSACDKRHRGTGTWFISGWIFNAWLSKDYSFLWLHGFAGCGKSILCSTAIQHTFRKKGQELKTGIAFFYFSFTDEMKQDESAMLRTLLLQLAGQVQDGYSDLERLKTKCHSGMPLVMDLVGYFQYMARRFHNVYILIDALDECPRYAQREKVLEIIKIMRNWEFPGLHLLVTSRDEIDIRESLKPADEEEVSMKNTEIDRDIENFISGRLNTDSTLRKWKPHHDKIQKSLAERAHGVFRWVECQFETLKRCPQSEYHLHQCLQSLPRTLDETYERMLCNIDETMTVEAQRILTLICFSARPLTVAELIEGIAVDLKEPAHLDVTRRLQNADDVRGICPGLIDISYQPNKRTDERRHIWTSSPSDWNKIDEETADEDFGDTTDEESIVERGEPVVRIAHFSVQEYLESERIEHSNAAKYAMKSEQAHLEIAHICLVYLLEPRLTDRGLNNVQLKDFPLTDFAAYFWPYHYKGAADRISNCLPLKLFQQEDKFQFWASLPKIQDLSLYSEDPVTVASCLGLDQIVSILLEVHHKVNGQGYDANGHFGALYLASRHGHEKAVKILLNSCADPITSSSQVLGVASKYGREKVVRLLLDWGADPSFACWGGSGNALVAASKRNHMKVVRMLLESGADTHIYCGWGANALFAAIYSGFEKLAMILLESSINVKTQGRFGDAMTCKKRHQKVDDHRTILDVQNRFFSDALPEAAHCGYKEIVEILIENNADINGSTCDYGTALEAASGQGHLDVVKILIEKGANINAVSELYGTPLHVASTAGKKEVVKILIENGANVNPPCLRHGTPLQGASSGGYKEVVEVLIENGANPNTQIGNQNALQTASLEGHWEVVKMLIDGGANVNTQGGYYGDALQAASTEGHKEVAQILLDSGANINAQGGYHGNALQAASREGHREVAQLLLDSGANVNAQGGYYGNALQAASRKGDRKLAQILLDSGANVNAQGGEYRNALYAAFYHGYDEVAQMLLANGAAVYA